MPGLAFLADHIVKGRALVPGAAMFELMLSVLGTLAAAGSASHTSVQRIAISAPLVLLPAAPSTLQCLVDCSSGALVLQSGSGPQQQPARHLNARAGACLLCHRRCSWPCRLCCLLHKLHAGITPHAGSATPKMPLDAGAVWAASALLTSAAKPHAWLDSSTAKSQLLPTAVAVVQQPLTSEQPGSFGAHPAALDAATHTAAALASSSDDGVCRPALLPHTTLPAA